MKSCCAVSRRLSTLKFMDIFNRAHVFEVGMYSAEEIYEELAKCKTLTHLDLQSNSLLDEQGGC